MTRRTFVRRSLLAAPVALGAGAAYGRYVERHAVEVVELEVPVGLTEPLTAALLGDFHFDPLYETDYLSDVVARTSALAPDLVLFAGDFVSDSAERVAELADILARTEAKAGRFAVLGNHDHWVAPGRVEAVLAAAGISVLRNRSVPLPGRPGWFLTGLESFWGGTPSLTPITETPADARHILLVHEPDSFDLLTDPRIALQLSGHSHGGQVRVPFGGAVCLPSWGKKYPAGLYERGGRRLYVNRGIGTVKRHFRINCRPEITLLRLT